MKSNVKLIDRIFVPNLLGLAENKRYVVDSGGTRSGKTYQKLMAIIHFLKRQERKEQKCIFSIVSRSIPHLKTGAIRDFKDLMQNHFCYWDDEKWNITDRNYYFSKNVILEFFSCDNAAKVHGPARDYLFINEAQHISRDIWRHLAVRTKYAKLIDFNPTRKFWAHDLPREFTTWTDSTYLDNPYLTENQVQEIEANKENKTWWDVYGKGIVGKPENVVYTGWEKITLQRYLDLDKEEFIGDDFGYTHPMALAGCKYDDFERAFYLNEYLYKSFIKAGDYVKEYKAVGLEPDGETIIVCDNARPELVNDLAAAGYYAIAPKKPPVISRIEFLRSCKVYYTETSTNIDYEFNNYLNKKDKDENILDEPEKKDDDLMDAIGYVTWFLKSHLGIKMINE